VAGETCIRHWPLAYAFNWRWKGVKQNHTAISVSDHLGRGNPIDGVAVAEGNGQADLA